MRLGVEAALVDRRFVPGDVLIEDGRIAGYGLGSANGRGVAVPGFIDLQVNGFAGVDFLGADAEGYRSAGEALLETGVTAYLPTFITGPEDELVAALRGCEDRRLLVDRSRADHGEVLGRPRCDGRAGGNRAPG